MTALVLFAHGSRVDGANNAVRELAARLQSAADVRTEAAFLEIAHPDLYEISGTLVAAGADEIFVIPFFLAPGIHLQRDLPRIITELSGIHEGVRIAATAGLDGHPALLSIVLDRAQEALSSRSPEFP